MQLFGPTGTRSEWRDRNPTQQWDGNFGDVAGAANLDSITYVVPANRRAFLVHGFVYAHVTTAFAAGQTADIRIEMTKPPATIFEMMMLHFRGASPLGEKQQEVMGGLYMIALDAIQARITVAAGAGVVRGTFGWMLIEYDA